ncbi:hypothetical protein K469DRAFT_551608, partial [Zopfia rhizophila CBS 207.26]
GYITKITFNKHNVILLYCYKNISRDLNITIYMNSIYIGIRHLYSLKLTHNNLNPINITVDYDDNLIILNFRSYKRFSE